MEEVKRRLQIKNRENKNVIKEKDKNIYQYSGLNFLSNN